MFYRRYVSSGRWLLVSGSELMKGLSVFRVDIRCYIDISYTDTYYYILYYTYLYYYYYIIYYILYIILYIYYYILSYTILFSSSLLFFWSYLPPPNPSPSLIPIFSSLPLLSHFILYLSVLTYGYLYSIKIFMFQTHSPFPILFQQAISQY